MIERNLRNFLKKRNGMERARRGSRNIHFLTLMISFPRLTLKNPLRRDEEEDVETV